MNPFLIGLPAFIVLLFAGYFLRERSLGRLDVNQAGTLVLELRPHRIRQLTGMLGVLAIFIVLRYSLPQFQNSLFMGYLAITMAVIAYAYWSYWQALRNRIFPQAFVRLFRTSIALDFLAYAFLVGSVASTVFIDTPK